MRITGVRTTLLDHRPPEDCGGVESQACVLELATDSELTGLTIGLGDVRAVVASIGESFLHGEDPRGVTGLWQRMRDAYPPSRRTSADAAAIAALDVALWDLKAKISGEPLWKCLGGARPRINAIASQIDPVADDHQLLEWCADMARQYGFRSASLKAGRDTEADLRRLGLLHRALSERTVEPTLMLDAAGAWTADEAITRIKALEAEFDITLVEDPVPPGDCAGLRQVSESVRAAVCTGGSLLFPEDFLPHFRHHGMNVVQIDIARHGITGAMQLADAAFGYELPVTLRAAPGNIHGHAAAAMPYVLGAEVTDPGPGAGGLFTGDSHVEDGWLITGDAPGHGLAVDRDALTRAACGER